jgi:hypothetical protein
MVAMSGSFLDGGGLDLGDVVDLVDENADNGRLALDRDFHDDDAGVGVGGRPGPCQTSPADP